MDNTYTVHKKQSSDFEYWIDYDLETDQKVHYKDSNGFEYWYKDGRIIHSLFPMGFEDWFSDTGRLIRRKFPTGHIEEYDENGKLVLKLFPDGAKEEYQYDAQGRLKNSYDLFDQRLKRKLGKLEKEEAKDGNDIEG